MNFQLFEIQPNFKLKSFEIHILLIVQNFALEITRYTVLVTLPLDGFWL